MTQKPTTSLDINTAFVSPVTPNDQEVVLVASVVNQSRHIYYSRVGDSGGRAAGCHCYLPDAYSRLTHYWSDASDDASASRRVGMLKIRLV